MVVNFLLCDFFGGTADLWTPVITSLCFIWAVWVVAEVWYIYTLRKKNKKEYVKVLEEKNSARRNEIFSSFKNVFRYIGLSFVYLPWIIIDFFFEIRGYLTNNISFDRNILSKDGHPLLRLSLRIAVMVPIVILLPVTVIDFVRMIITGNPNSPIFAGSNNNNVLSAVFSQYLDPGNVSESEGLGAIVAFILATAGIVCLSGLLVSSIVNWISQRKDRWQKGLITYENVKPFDSYIVIIGINEQTASIARRALESDEERYVLIQTSQDVERVRPELESKIDDKNQDRIVYYAGDRTSYEDIEWLHLEKAVEVYILGESVEESYRRNNDEQLEKDHDAYNISCLEHIAEYIKLNVKKEEKENKPRLNVHVQFDYQSTFTAFKATHLYQKLGRNIRFIPFNIHELWAKKVLIDNLAIYPAGNKTELKVQRYNPIDTYIDKGGERIKVDDEKTVHLIIIGMNQMGTALATQAALLCHFPNFANNKERKTTITFIDENAKREAEYYMGRYSALFELSQYIIKKDSGTKLDKVYEHIPNFKEKTSRLHHLVTENEDCLLDVNWEFIEGNAASKPVQDYIIKIAKEHTDEIVTVAICFNDSQQSLASAMYLPETVYDKCNQILVYQRSIFDVANDVAKGDSDWRRYRNLSPFGMSEASYTENPFDSHLAALDYYLYKNEERKKQIEKYFSIRDEKAMKEFESSFLRNVDDAWENAGIVRKTASIDSVDSIPFKLRSMGIEYCRNLDEINKNIEDENVLNGLIEAEHNRWMVQRLISGFRHISSDEQDKVIQVPEEDKDGRKRLIEEKKNGERASYYICSYKRMGELEKGSVGDGMVLDDESVIRLIPYLLRGQELLNVSILTSEDKRYDNSQHKKVLKEIFDGKFLLIESRKEESKEDKVFCEHAFWMADTAVSNEQWRDVTGKRVNADDELPVVNVSWNDVQDFLDILRKKSGLYFDLPSQKEWRNAAKLSPGNGDSGWKVNTEKVTKDKKIKGENINCPDMVRNSEEKDNKVLHHFLGNVWEWTRKRDEHGLRIFAGGSWRFGYDECNPAKEAYCFHSWDTDSKSDDLGFRLVWKYDRNVPSLLKENQENEDISKSNSESLRIDNITEWFKKDIHKLVEIKNGEFKMGANKGDSGNPDENEGPSHRVYISESFYICKVPVTQSLWNAVMEIKKNRLNKTENRIGDEIPQTDISWFDVSNFIKKLNEEKAIILKAIFPELPENSDVHKYEFRLPTEAEWEYAAKGGHMTKEPYAIYAAKDDMKNATDVAWFDQPSIHEVAQKEPNELGLYDMSGNIWEWCHDFYIADMYVACKEGTNEKVQNTFIKDEYQDKGYITDPIALDTAYSAHVFRGGSWRSSEWDCRCTRANYWGENYKANDLGFRLVLARRIKDLGKAAKDDNTKIKNTNTSNQQ